MSNRPSWISCGLAMTAALLVVVAPPAGAATARDTKRTTTTRLTVIAGKPSEFHFRLSKRTVHRGTVIFTVVNHGRLSHDFKIHGKKTKLLSPGKSTTLRVAFKKPGRYPYVCTVPGHAAAGMKGVLRVT
jgi:uncharacterized cupredoxin-like copper-binding protein